jgi:hypothetical protein
MMSAGTRFRLPRKSKKAQTKFFQDMESADRLTANEWRRLRRCWVLAPTGWRTIRKVAAHVAMGDTRTCRLRERDARRRLDQY